MSVREISEPDLEIPDGYVGNLSGDQEQALRDMWAGYFDWCEKASGSGTGGKASAFEDDSAQDPKKAGIPKGDAAKEEAKRAEEEAGLQALLKEYGPDSLKRALWEFIKLDNPDGIFLRFLRARKWDVTRAMGMFASCLKWRLDNDVEALVRGGDLGNGKSIEKFLDQQRSGKTYALGTAVNEQPICYIHVKKHMTFGQPGSSMQKYVIYAMESFRCLMMPPGDKVILFFDLTGFGLKNMDWNCILFIVKCLEAFYPESLGILYIHNAPWIFTGIWKVLGPLLDPVVRAKVAFTKNAKDVADRVPAERLISDLGGKVKTGFQFEEPEEGENAKLDDKQGREQAWNNYMKYANEYEDATRKWIDSNGRDNKIVEKRNYLVKQLRIAQFEMEPYIRGLTVYHRNGTVDGQGKVTWLYKQEDGSTIRHVAGRKSCVATLRRELREMDDGSSAADAEARTKEAADNRDWVTLYGDRKTARKLEGADAVPGGDDEDEAPRGKQRRSGAAAAGAGAAAGAAAGAGAVAAGRRSTGSRRQPSQYDDDDQGGYQQQQRQANYDEPQQNYSRSRRSYNDDDRQSNSRSRRSYNDEEEHQNGYAIGDDNNGYANGNGNGYNNAQDDEDLSRKEKAKLAPKKAAAALGGAGAAVAGGLGVKKFKKKRAEREAAQNQNDYAGANGNGDAAPQQQERKSRGTGKAFAGKGPADAIEVPRDVVDIPDGAPGKLTDNQKRSLREMWAGYFDWCEKASGSGTGGKGGAFEETDQDPKKAGIPKGDAAKEEAKRAEEEAGLQALLQEYGPDSLRRALWEFVKFDNPDGIFLRFLRARKWDVTRAMGMFASCLKWRLDNDVEALVRGGDLGNGKEVEKFLDQQRSGKTYALGTAINEQPICYIHVKKHMTFGQPGTSMQKYVIYAMESFRTLMQPPQEKVILFFDLTGFGLKNMDWNCILFIVKCLEAFYPESLGILYIHNAPWIFTGIWKVLGPLLDPVVRAKVAFTKNAKDVADRVPAERLIAELDGQVTTGFDFVEPREGENEKMNDKATKDKLWKKYMSLVDEFEDATRKQIDSDGRDQKNENKRDILIKKLRIAQFDLEPYIRGMTVYARDGTVDGQGKVTWIYKTKSGKTFRHVVGRKTCCATLRREIEEMEEQGLTAKEVESKSEKAMQQQDWVMLYGDEDIAMEIEGQLNGKGDKSSGGGQQQRQVNGGAQRRPQQQQQQQYDDDDEDDEEDEEDQHDDNNRGYIAAAAGGVAAAAGGAAAIATGAVSNVTGYFTGGNQQHADEDEEDDYRSARRSGRSSQAQTPGEYHDATSASSPTLYRAHDADESMSGIPSNRSTRSRSISRGQENAPVQKDENGFIDYSARRRRQYDDEDEPAPAPAPRRVPSQGNMRRQQEPEQEKPVSNGVLGGLAGAGTGLVTGLASTLGYGGKEEQEQPRTNGRGATRRSYPAEEPLSNGAGTANKRYDDGYARGLAAGKEYEDGYAEGFAAARRSMSRSRLSNYDDDDFDARSGYSYDPERYQEGRARSIRRRSQAQKMGDAYYGGGRARAMSGPGRGTSTYKSERSVVQGYEDGYKPSYDDTSSGKLSRRISGMFGRKR